ncbi:MAG: hypothetical protein AB7F50_11295 [Fimbriimonadaceae bacterium]
MHYYVVSFADGEVHVSPEPPEVWGFVTYQKDREGTEVRDLESAVQLARELCRRGDWPEFPPDLQHSRSPQPGKEGDVFYVSLRAVPPGPYGGSSDSIAVSVRPEDGSVARATAILGHTYADQDLRLTAEQAGDRATVRIREVLGLEATLDRVEGPVWLPDPPEGDARGDLADAYGPSRGGPKHCRLAHIVHASARDRDRIQHFELTVDAKDGTVMSGFLTHGSSPSKKDQDGTLAAEVPTEPAGGRNLAMVVSAGTAVALAAAGWWKLGRRNAPKV